MSDTRTVTTIEALERRVAELEMLLDLRPLPAHHRRQGDPIVTTRSVLISHVDGVLACPRCNAEDGALHHVDVTAFDRFEDAIWTTVTTVRQGLVSSQRIPSIDCGNPSSRRHGLSIGFWCEQCGKEQWGTRATMWLDIAQHKGATLMSWRFEEPTLP